MDRIGFILGISTLSEVSIMKEIIDMIKDLCSNDTMQFVWVK